MLSLSSGLSSDGSATPKRTLVPPRSTTRVGAVTRIGAPAADTESSKPAVNAPQRPAPVACGRRTLPGDEPVISWFVLALATPGGRLVAAVLGLVTAVLG